MRMRQGKTSGRSVSTRSPIEAYRVKSLGSRPRNDFAQGVGLKEGSLDAVTASDTLGLEKKGLNAFNIKIKWFCLDGLTCGAVFQPAALFSANGSGMGRASGKASR